MANSFPNTTVRLQDNKSNSACASLYSFFLTHKNQRLKWTFPISWYVTYCDTPLMDLFQNWVRWPCTSFKLGSKALWVVENYKSVKIPFFMVENYKSSESLNGKWIEVWFRKALKLSFSEIMSVDRIHFPTWLLHSNTVKQTKRLTFLGSGRSHF